MQFIANWRIKFPRLWSVRLALVAAVLSGLEAGFNFYMTGSAPVIAAAAMVLSLGAAFSRIVAQPELDQRCSHES